MKQYRKPVCFSTIKADVTVNTPIWIVSKAATEIKRVFRGRKGREEAQLTLQRRNDSRQRSLFDYFTIQLQRCFRGYYSRKYRKDHAARKAYIRQIEEKNREVLEMMSQYALLQVSVRSLTFWCCRSSSTKLLNELHITSHRWLW